MPVSFFRKSLSFLALLVFSLPLIGGELRVVSYNIKHGEGMDGKLDLERTAAVLKKLNADVIALQEVDKNCIRSGGVDQAATLAKMLGMHHYFGKAIPLGKGEYGNAVLSKFPIEATKLHQLPGAGEKRVVAEVQVKVGGEKVSICSNHLDHKSEQVRMQQIEAFAAAVADYQHPLLLTGDFNAQPDSKVMAYCRKQWTLVDKEGAKKTCPATNPRVEIDYCVLLNWKVKKAFSRVVDESVASDHRPVLTVLQW
ncbi:Metal-dependent hydrolase, endonuclease/exonuclease/phosphatase family [Rubritalea squalenifaciens DSM 18772]|uniref:Metal-dependent hydrolase, endonuclease/exonuclease/phosphatase family n=1 Tax=Rubritalea squalenifaciens DSM 18772 TaxID=1123071 RepID=A0A1M6GRN9_9BACT|nr:endonuclease/exonuclease/phosphatase family protein [Rubritalea squalenifaciens]SHJ12526.1 Metal-dependent hydrolase, endonuclease/exonuclease/phosphatase family [Rubritalea squalenifaciens DSM 18772]